MEIEILDWFYSLNLVELLGLMCLLCLCGLAIFVCIRPPTPNYREQEHIKKVYGPTPNYREQEHIKKIEELPRIVWQKARNYRSVQPKRCCATCKYIEWDWDCVQVCTEDEERWGVDTIAVCDKWKKKER